MENLVETTCRARLELSAKLAGYAVSTSRQYRKVYGREVRRGEGKGKKKENRTKQAEGKSAERKEENESLARNKTGRK